MLSNYRLALGFKWLRSWFIAFNNHRKILTLSRQSLHKCIHTMASSASFTQNENIKRTRFPHLCFASPTKYLHSVDLWSPKRKERSRDIPCAINTYYRIFVWFVEEDAIYRTSNRSIKARTRSCAQFCFNVNELSYSSSAGFKITIYHLEGRKISYSK